MKTTLCGVLLALLTTSLAAGEISGWRGEGAGRFPDAKPPLRWSPETNVVWKVSLPGSGYNSPAHSAGRVFVTAEPAQVLCYDAATGKELWRGAADYAAALGKEKAAEIAATYERFEAEKRAARQPFEKQRQRDPQAKEPEALKTKMADIDRRRGEFEKQFPPERRGGTGNAAATPVTDGKRVYVVFATGIVAAFDMGGQRAWIRHVEPSHLGFGHSASPVLADGKLVVHIKDLIALDPASGAEVWRAKLPAKHGTPVVAQVAGEELLVTPSGAIVRAADGKLLAEKLFELTDNSPLVHEGVIYAHEGGSATALRLPDALDENFECEELWQTKAKGEQRMASAAWHDGLLYSGNRQGILDVIDAESGEVVYQKRLRVGEMFPSVVVAGEHLFVSGTEGKTVVLEPGRKFKQVAASELERFSSTPLVVGDRLFVRTDKALYCLGETGDSTFISKPDDSSSP